MPCCIGVRRPLPQPFWKMIKPGQTLVQWDFCLTRLNHFHKMSSSAPIGTKKFSPSRPEAPGRQLPAALCAAGTASFRPPLPNTFRPEQPSRGGVSRTDRRTAPALRARPLRSYVSVALLLRAGAGLLGTPLHGVPEDAVLPGEDRCIPFQPEPADEEFAFAQKEKIGIQPFTVQALKIPLPF